MTDGNKSNGRQNDSKQPDYNVAIEDPNSEKLHRVGALWEQDSDKSPMSGVIRLSGTEKRLVLFRNDNDGGEGS